MESSPTSRRPRTPRPGPIEFLVNNIGQFDLKDFFETSDERWREYFEANVVTGVRMSGIVLKEMLDRNSSSIVLIATDAAVGSL